ncbi:MAG: hypothetical protein JSU86_09265 [Phycisphaerales bacterium]|nr:MAG: hypothetical protein JSU86_09265 [Phycisphaerales bacterium]
MIRKAIIVIFFLMAVGFGAVGFSLLAFSDIWTPGRFIPQLAIVNFVLAAAGTTILVVLTYGSVRFRTLRLSTRISLLACGGIASASSFTGLWSVDRGIGFIGTTTALGVEEGGIHLDIRGGGTRRGWFETDSTIEGAILLPYFELSRQRVEIFLPFWIPVTALALPWLIVCWRKRRPTAGACSRCSYNLRGSTTSVCPECGLEFRDYRGRLTALIEQLLDGRLTVSEFDDWYFSFYAEETPRDALSNADHAFFRSVHARLSWTGPSPDDESYAHGWMSATEYVDFVRQQYDRYMSGSCLSCGYDLRSEESGACPECGTKIGKP